MFFGSCSNGTALSVILTNQREIKTVPCGNVVKKTVLLEKRKDVILKLQTETDPDGFQIPGQLLPSIRRKGALSKTANRNFTAKKSALIVRAEREVNMGKGKYTWRSIIVRCLVILVGVIITAYGAEAFVLASLGSDPVTAFVQGLGKVIGVQFGTAMNIFNIIFFVVILIFCRRTIGIGTVLYTFTLGTFCTLLDPYIVALIGSEPTLVVRIILIVTGTIALGIGLGLYQAAEFGCGPSDAFNQFMAKTVKLQLRWWRMIFDAIMVVGALIMGGVVHVGTLVGMFLVGPILGPVLNRMAPVVNKWAGNEDIVYEAK